MKKRTCNLLAGVFLILVGCGQAIESQEDVSANQADISQTELLAMIHQHLRPAYASSLEQCKAVGIGAKPCGGPERYAIYSTETADEPALLALIERYNTNQREENIRQGLMSDCQAVIEPAFELYNGLCRVVRRLTH